MADRDTLVYRAKLAEQAERYNDMVESIKTVASLDVELTVEERNLLSVAYKNLIGKNRNAWRTLTSLGKDDNPKNEKVLSDYISLIESELRQNCTELIRLADNHLLPAATTAEAKVFFYKMKADYYRYVAEIANGSEKHDTAEQSLLAYKTASDLATSELAPTHPIRLGLALNFSVFYYEILSSPERACRLARAAFDDAIAGLDSLSEEENYKDATLIMQLLRDNLTLWSTDIEGSDEKGVKEDLQDVDDA